MSELDPDLVALARAIVRSAARRDHAREQLEKAGRTDSAITDRSPATEKSRAKKRRQVVTITRL